MHLLESTNILHYMLIDHSNKIECSENIPAQEQFTELPQNLKAIKKLESFIDSGKTDNFDLNDMDDNEKDEFLGMLYELLQSGVIEYENFEINTMKEKRYILNEVNSDCFAF